MTSKNVFDTFSVFHFRFTLSKNRGSEYVFQSAYPIVCRQTPMVHAGKYTPRWPEGGFFLASKLNDANERCFIGDVLLGGRGCDVSKGGNRSAHP